jgi:hypothetical protein
MVAMVASNPAPSAGQESAEALRRAGRIDTDRRAGNLGSAERRA